MSSFIDKAIYKINSSLTPEEVEENFDFSCCRCRRAGTCDESRCPIAKAKNNRLIVLESYSAPKTATVIFEKTRHYTISEENQKRGRVQKLFSQLAKLGKEKNNRKFILTVDEASVALTLGEIDRMYDFLVDYPQVYLLVKQILEEEQ